MSMSRRALLKRSVAAGVVGAVGLPLAASSKRGRKGRKKKDRNKKTVSGTGEGLFFGYEPFTQALPIPNTLTRLVDGGRLDPKPGAYPRMDGLGRGPVAPTGSFEDVSHAIAPEFGHFPDMNQFNTGFSNGNTHEAEFGLVI